MWNIQNNKQNQRQSIHRASKNIEKRFNNHKSSSKELSSTIKKYGVNNFTFEIIEECSIEEFYEKERYYIKKYNTKIPDGYNLTDGGEHSFNTTGYYRTAKCKSKYNNIGYYFSYTNYINNKYETIISQDIELLEKKVKDKKGIWKITDKIKAKETLKQNKKDLANNISFFT